MILEYLYCSSCGYEDFHVEAGYSRQTANSEWYFCPLCNEETSNFDEYEGD